jgi:hypothetical protein
MTFTAVSSFEILFHRQVTEFLGIIIWYIGTWTPVIVNAMLGGELTCDFLIDIY